MAGTLSPVRGRAPDRTDGGGAPALTHLVDPDRDGFTYCGIEIRRRVERAGECVVCIAEEQRRSRRDWTPAWWDRWRRK